MKFSCRKLSVVGWDEFLRQISILILLNRSNYDYRRPEAHRESLITHFVPRGSVVSHINLTSTSIVFNRQPSISSEIHVDESFRKHGKVLEKLQKQYEHEEAKRKRIGSLLDFSLVESFDEQNNAELPKLKTNRKDERRAVSEPWLVVKEMEQLRSLPVPIRKTQYFHI